MIAVVPVREGVAPSGSDETVSEAGGRVILIGTRVSAAVVSIAPFASQIWTIESSLPPAPCSRIIATTLTSLGLDDQSVVLPASPDGRDLAPHISVVLDRRFFAGALEVTWNRVSVSRQGGLAIADVNPVAPFVATLQIGVRTPEVLTTPAQVVELDARNVDIDEDESTSVTTLAVLPPDAATIDLGEAPRILGGGAGLADEARFVALASVAAELDASMGVTRVITDRGWVGHDRQIGTTGVIVDPDLYIAFGISGAVQHTSGLGNPEHIISVNTDAHCPMMQLSDLAIVADANETLDELARLITRSDVPT